MGIPGQFLPVTVLATVLIAAPGCGDKEKSHDQIVREDLLLIIETLDRPCGEVSQYELVDDLKYEIHCESGDSYTLSVSDVGRVEID